MISTKNAWGEILTQTHLGTLVTSVLFEFSRSKPASAKLTLLNLPLNTGTEFPIRSPDVHGTIQRQLDKTVARSKISVTSATQCTGPSSTKISQQFLADFTYNASAASWRPLRL
jgi:hypothetical protein